MLKKPFGGSFTFNYYPHADGTAFDPPSQTPTIYIFDAYPSDDDARNDTSSSAIETISSWTEGTANIRPFTVGAIADPADGTKEKSYWAAINYTPVTGGSSTVDILEFRMVRPDGQTAEATPTAAEMKERDTTLATYYSTDSDIDNYVANAESKLKAFMSNKGFHWTRIENPEDLKETVIYWALTDMMRAQINTEGDRFFIKAEDYAEVMMALRDQLKIEYDANNDDTVSSSEERTVPSKLNFIR